MMICTWKKNRGSSSQKSKEEHFSQVQFKLTRAWQGAGVLGGFWRMHGAYSRKPRKLGSEWDFYDLGDACHRLKRLNNHIAIDQERPTASYECLGQLG